MKTVTLKKAADGIDRVRIEGRYFPIGTAVQDVPEKIVKQLEQMEGVQVQVDEPSSKTDESETRRK